MKPATIYGTLHTKKSLLPLDKAINSY